MSGRDHQGGSGLGHVPALDGLRAFAVIAVLLFHADAPFATGGFLGVSVFFTISGFLVTTLLLEEHARTGTIDLVAFARRRGRRLLPAAWTCLAVVAIFTPFWTATQRRDLTGDLLAALTNVSNWRAATSDASYQDLFDSSPSPLAHFWSLSIEMQFYVALPVIAAMTLRRRSQRRFTWTIAALGTASLASIALTNDFDLAYNGTQTRAIELLTGVGLALVVSRSSPAESRSGRMETTVGVVGLTGLIVLVGIATIHSSWLIDGGLVGIALLSCGAIVGALGTGPFSTLLARRPLVAIGKVSYGIYLFHWPLFLILSPDRTGLDGVSLFALRVLATTVATVASYRLLETPIRQRQRLATPRSIRIAAASAATLLVATAIAMPGERIDATTALIEQGDRGLVRFGEPTPIDATTTTPETSQPAPPPITEPIPPRALTAPTTTREQTPAPVTPAAVRILAVGSDIAARDALVGLAGERPVELIDAVRPDCPFATAADVLLHDETISTEHCEPTSDIVARAIGADDEPNLVVIAAGSIDSGLPRRENDVGFPTHDELTELAQRSAITREAVGEIVEPFTDAGIPVVMSWWGEPGLFELELGRIDARSPGVVGFARSAPELRQLVDRTVDEQTRPNQPTRALVIGDSTSLVLARALHDADQRLDVLWAGDNGCPVVRAVALHGDRGLPPRSIDCPDFVEKLPPIVDEFAPDVVIVMPGTIAHATLTFPDDDRRHEPGSHEWVTRHDDDFEALLRIIRPNTAETSPAVLVVDAPAIQVGPFSTGDMATPDRLAAVNRQIERWAAAHDGVDVLGYAGPLERYEADNGRIRPDYVHPAAIELTEIARTHYVDQVLAAAVTSR